MPSRIEPDLEAVLERELRKLPDQKAPATLAPRVLAAIRTQTRAAWWRQPFWAWPTPAKAAGFGLWLIGVGSLLRLGSGWMSAGSMDGILPRPLTEIWGVLAGLSEGLAILAHAMVLVLRAGLQPWVIGVLMVSLLMYLLCLGLGTAFFHVIHKRL